jgi:hypothetical protein
MRDALVTTPALTRLPRRALRALVACAIGFAATLPAMACGDHAARDPARDKEQQLQDYSYSVAVAAIVDRCSARYPAMAPALQEQQARWDGQLRWLADSRALADSLPVEERAAVDGKARTEAIARFEKETRGLDPERSCRWYIEDVIEEVSSRRNGGCCSHDEPKLDHPHFWTLVRQAELQRAIVLCRRESPELGEQAAADVAAWENDNAELAAARHALGGKPQPRIIAVHARSMTDEQFAFQLAMRRADDLCGDVVGAFAQDEDSQRAREAAKAEEAADKPPYVRALGKFYGQNLSLKVLAPMCTARFPAMATDIAAATDAWNRREAPFIAAIDGFEDVVDDADQAEFAEGEEQMQRAYTFILDRQAPEDAQEYCRGSMANFASGKWRTQDPESFQTLTNGRPAD